MLRLLKIIKIKKWDCHKVIMIPLNPQTRDEPEMKIKVWRSHHWGKGVKKI